MIALLYESFAVRVARCTIMDIVAVALAVLAFIVLYALIELVDRV